MNYEIRLDISAELTDIELFKLRRKKCLYVHIKFMCIYLLKLRVKTRWTVLPRVFKTSRMKISVVLLG